MSLSKYFETSDAFLPDNIVKDVEKIDQPWTPSPLPGKKPFAAADKITPPPQAKASAARTIKSEENAADSPTGKISSTEDSAVEPDADVAPEPGAETIAEPIPPAPTAHHQPVDLSKYVEKEAAEQAIEEAYLRGCEDGRNGVEQDFEDATKMLVAASQQIDNIREMLISNSSRELQDFALAIAEKILRISLREQDTTLIATIEEALTRAVKSDEFTVYVNPDDYEFAVTKAPEIVTGISGLNNLVVKKDATIERGGAKLESDNCTIDATVTSQLDIIREEIRKKL